MSKRQNVINTIIVYALTLGAILAIVLVNRNYGDKTNVGLTVLYFLAGAFVFGFINSLVHETGHLLAGKKNGFAFVSMKVFFLCWKKVGERIEFGFCMIGDEAGNTEMIPKYEENMRKRYARMTWGGIIGSLIMTLIFIAPLFLTKHLPVWAFEMLAIGLPISVYFFVGSIIPMRNEGTENDGLVLYNLKKDTDESKVKISVLCIHAGLYQGKTPSEIDEKYYFDLPQIREDDINFLMLSDARYAYYVDKEDNESAIKTVNRMAGLLDYAPKDVKYPIKAEELYCACAIKKDGDLADEIMYDIDKYINSVNNGANVRAKMAYLVYVLKEFDNINTFYEKALKEAERNPVKGIGVYEVKLVERIMKDVPSES